MNYNMNASLIATGLSGTNPNNAPIGARSDSNVPSLFPCRLHYVLLELEKDGHDHIAAWQPHGRSFKVHNRDAFTKLVLPCWFRQSKFSSFQRQLNIYGFLPVHSGPDKGSYYHELFVKDKPWMAGRIPRTYVKGLGHRRPKSVSDVPNFDQSSPLTAAEVLEPPPAPQATARVPIAQHGHNIDARIAGDAAATAVAALGSGANAIIAATQVQRQSNILPSLLRAGSSHGTLPYAAVLPGLAITGSRQPILASHMAEQAINDHFLILPAVAAIDLAGTNQTSSPPRLELLQRVIELEQQEHQQEMERRRSGQIELAHLYSLQQQLQRLQRSRLDGFQQLLEQRRSHRTWRHEPASSPLRFDNSLVQATTSGSTMTDLLYSLRR